MIKTKNERYEFRRPSEVSAVPALRRAYCDERQRPRHAACSSALRESANPHNFRVRKVAGKGFGHTRVEAPSGSVDVVNTHTCANYGHQYEQRPGQPWRTPNDGDAPIRLAQLLQLAQFLSTSVGEPGFGGLCGPPALELSPHPIRPMCSSPLCMNIWGLASCRLAARTLLRQGQKRAAWVFATMSSVFALTVSWYRQQAVARTNK